MPFTASEFLDVFAAYNEALWPLALWVFTAPVFAMCVARERVWTPLPMLLLAGHWLWAGILYHALFFAAVNPAAWLFAALFVLQAVFFIVAASSGLVVTVRRGSWRHVVSSTLIFYSLVYPAIAGRMGSCIHTCRRLASHARRSCSQSGSSLPCLRPRSCCRSFRWRGRCSG